MEQKRGSQIAIIAILAVAVVIMSVGFAVTAYTQTLNINGDATVKAAKWDVHFDTDTANYSESQGSVQASAKTINNTTWSYTITLTKPGDFYEATVNVLNEGTFDAALSGVTISGISADQAKYVTYSVTYNDNTAFTTTTTSGINEATLTAKTGSHPVKVRVAYVQPANYSDLPTAGDVTLTITTALDYTQVLD